MIYLQIMKNRDEKTSNFLNSKIILNPNKSTAKLNIANREFLKKQLIKESKLVSKNSMGILSEFKKF